MTTTTRICRKYTRTQSVRNLETVRLEYTLPSLLVYWKRDCFRKTNNSSVSNPSKISVVSVIQNLKTYYSYFNLVKILIPSLLKHIHDRPTPTNTPCPWKTLTPSSFKQTPLQFHHIKAYPKNKNAILISKFYRTRTIKAESLC